MRAALATLSGLALAAAAAGWTRAPEATPPSIRIVDVHPLAQRDFLSHYVEVRVATHSWPLLAPRPDRSGLDPRPRLRHWRLYVDGYPVADVTTTEAVTPYLPPGTHWIAVELRRPDHARLSPPVWSEPVILHMPDSYSGRR
jgi:hypothetical protein